VIQNEAVNADYCIQATSSLSKKEDLVHQSVHCQNWVQLHMGDIGNTPYTKSSRMQIQNPICAWKTYAAKLV
jgi:hypothetical protein